MATLQVNPNWPQIDSLQSLVGWRREFCVELLGEGSARVFVRAVSKSSLKADELKRGILFHRLESRFGNFEGCVEALRAPPEKLADSAVCLTPSKNNLFAAVAYNRECWDEVVRGLERWQRKPVAGAPKVADAHP